MRKLSQAIKNIRWLNSNKRTTEAFDSKSDTVTFTTADVSSDSSATSWTSVSQLTSGLTHATLLNRISAMMKNVRFLYKQFNNSYSQTSQTGSICYSSTDNTGNLSLNGTICGKIKIVSGYIYLKKIVTINAYSRANQSIYILNFRDAFKPLYSNTIVSGFFMGTDIFPCYMYIDDNIEIMIVNYKNSAITTTDSSFIRFTICYI